MVKLIGVAGGSGSGKTTLAEKLLAHFGRDRADILFQDAYYIDRSAQFKGDGSLNFDHPDAIDWKLMSDHLQALHAGSAISVPVYDFIHHRRLTESMILQPKEFIIVDGILLFVHDYIRDQFDVRIFVQTSEPVRFARRLKRDMEERGRTPEGVRIQFEQTVKPMHELYVEPSHVFAHRVVSGEDTETMQIPDL